jgi:hypothetical protein
MKKLAIVLMVFAIAAGAYATGAAEQEGDAAPDDLAVMIFDRGNVPAEFGSASDNVWTQ